MNDVNDIFDEFKSKNGKKVNQRDYIDYNEDFEEKKNDYDDRRKNDNFKQRAQEEILDHLDDGNIKIYLNIILLTIF